MPAMMVSPVSGSALTRKVGSSFEKRRSAFERFDCALLSTGVMVRLITGAGTWMDVMAMRVEPSVKVSPE